MFAMVEDDDTTLPSESCCDHRDMCGDSLVERKGDQCRCMSCGAQWIDRHVVIVGDETLR
jgi:hypothetical protein